ncbi:hypothetical protein LUZ60_014813 [Juncus effusus]|nr:hypothetical protein LUZ60_014813 [Juncus effusus]
MASVVVIVLVAVFDLIAFGLAIAAEQRRSTATVVPDNEKNYTYCVYNSDIATGLGIGALLFLLLSQIVIMAASKCFCCGSGLRPGGARSCAIFLFLFTWLAFIIGEACLIAGSVQNAYHTRYRTLFFLNPPNCQTLRKGVFAAGAAFVFFTAILSEFYYVSFSKAQTSVPYGGTGNIGMSSF